MSPGTHDGAARQQPQSSNICSDNKIIPPAVRHATVARQQAARRCPPIEGRFGPTLAARDPALTFPPLGLMPSTYGMTANELRAEAHRLLEAGWKAWEIPEVLLAPSEVAA